MHNLVWIIVEGGGGGASMVENNERPQPVTALPFPTIQFENCVTSYNSTAGSFRGNLSGFPAVLAWEDHLSLSRLEVDPSLKIDLPYPPLPTQLKERGYKVQGFSFYPPLSLAIPFFYDDSCSHMDITSKKYLTSDEVLNKVKTYCSTLDKTHPNALLIHLRNGKKPSDIINECIAAGLTEDNTIFILMGDHGFPRNGFDLFSGNHKTFHNLALTDPDIHVVAHLHYPGCNHTPFKQLVSSLDIAPTIAEIIGLSPETDMAEAEGISLVPYLENRERVIPERILRIDTHYINQEKYRTIGFVTEKYRYIFRFSNSWGLYPFYNYYPQSNPFTEELFRRCNDESENLVLSPSHYEVLTMFRDELLKTEEHVATQFYNASFEHPFVKNSFFGTTESYRGDLLGSTPATEETVQEGLYARMEKKIRKQGYERTFIYGEAKGIQMAIDMNYIDAHQYAGIITVGEGQIENTSIPVYSDEALTRGDLFDCLAIVSFSKETRLLENIISLDLQCAVISLFRDLCNEEQQLPVVATRDLSVINYFQNKKGIILAKDYVKLDMFIANTKKLSIDIVAVFTTKDTEEDSFCGIPLYNYFSQSTEELFSTNFDYILVPQPEFARTIPIIKPIVYHDKKIFQILDNQVIHPDSYPPKGSWEKRSYALNQADAYNHLPKLDDLATRPLVAYGAGQRMKSFLAAEERKVDHIVQTFAPSDGANIGGTPIEKFDTFWESTPHARDANYIIASFAKVEICEMLEKRGIPQHQIFTVSTDAVPWLCQIRGDMTPF